MSMNRNFSTVTSSDNVAIWRLWFHIISSSTHFTSGYILMTFSWRFIDLLIILVSIGLATRFNQINRRIIESRSGAGSGKHFWAAIRVNYYAFTENLLSSDDPLNISYFNLAKNCSNLNVGLFDSRIVTGSTCFTLAIA